MISIYKLKDDSLEFEKIGRIKDGHIIEGGDAMDRLVPRKLRDDEEALLQRFSGPIYIASSGDYTHKEDDTNGSEKLEIKDYYRVWVKSESDVPEGQTAHRGDGSAPADNSWYYEVPFSTSTVVDVGKIDKVRVDPTDHPSQQDLIDMGIADPDLSLTKSNGKAGVSLNPAEYREAESPLTLLHLYKRLYDQGNEYNNYLSLLQKELDNRGVISFERLVKSRLPKKDQSGWTEETGPRGATRWRRGEEIRYKPPGGQGESNGSSDTGSEETPTEDAHDPYNRPTEITTAAVGELETEDFEGGTFRFYDDDSNPIEDLTVVDVVGNPMTLMGPNAGYVEFEDGSYANLTGDDYADLFSEDDEVRGFTDADALVEREVYNEPTGEANPDGWDIQWKVKNEDRNLDRLDKREKEQFLKEWNAATPGDGVKDIEDAFYQIKAVTTSTGGQLLDKAMAAAHGIAGEPRTDEHMDDRDFEDSHDPTEEEVEAARIFTKASQKFMRENFGDEFTLHRGLGTHVVEPLYDSLLDQFAEGSTDDLVMKDNPVATWTSDHNMANSYDKGIVARKQFGVEDVLSTPEALLSMTDVRAMTDFSEGETNVAGWDMRVDPGDLYISKTNITFRDMMEDPVAAHLRDIEDENSGTRTAALHSFTKHIRHRGKVEAAEVLREKLEASEVYREQPDLFDSIPKQLEVMLDKADSSDEDVSETEVIDIRSDANWLNESREERSMEKGRRYVTSPDEAPEGYDVQEGPQGGLYYDTGTGDESSETEAETEAEVEPEESSYENQLAENDYEAEINDIVENYLQENDIDLTIPEDATHGDYNDAKDDWRESRDSLKTLLDAGHDPDDVFELVSVLKEREKKMRRRWMGTDRETTPTRNQPEEIEELTDEDLESWDGEMPDSYPDSLESMYALADMSDSYRQFRHSISQDGLFDISNRAIDRWGRALSGDPDYELPDLENMSSEELSPIANQDPESFRRIADARDTTGVITMYRAVPDFVDDVEIGDYIALNPDYVQRHGENVLDGQQGESWHILEETVPYEDIGWPGEVADEFVYSPKSIREKWPSHKDFYDDVAGTQKISIGKVAKNPNYVDDPAEAPDWATVQEGPQGGYYYEEAEKPTESDGEGDESPSAEDLISEIGLGSLDEVGEVISRGIAGGTDLTELSERIADEKSGRYINRVLKDVEQAASKRVDGYDNPVKMTYSWDDDFDFPDESEQKFMDSVDEETGQLAKGIMENWPLDFFSKEMAPLWKSVMEETGNTNLLKEEEQVTDTSVSEAEMNAVKAYKRHTEETLREIHGDTITVFRGVYGDAGHALIEAAESGEEVEWERRAVESYTTELTYAKSYAQNPGGVVVEQEIPVEDVWASSHTGFLDANENELVVQKESVETISPDNIHTPERLDNGAWNIEEVGGQIRRFRQ